MTLNATPPAEAIKAMPSTSATEVVLEADGLTKHFVARRRGRDVLRRTVRAVHAVDDVSLSLRRGRVTALVGESGSGKSTVARLLAQLYPRTSGDIRLHGQPVTVRGGRRFRAYCRQVQMIFQDPFASLNPVHTVRYHLTRALRIHRRAGDPYAPHAAFSKGFSRSGRPGSAHACNLYLAVERAARRGHSHAGKRGRSERSAASGNVLRLSWVAPSANFSCGTFKAC